MKRFTDSVIVLRSYDVGEADRFCILFTEQHGKIAARVKGVRKLTSRMGSGSILPFCAAELDLYKGSSGYTITAAVPRRWGSWQRSLEELTYAEQVAELLMCLLEDEHAEPALFAACDSLLSASPLTKDSVVAFSMFACMHMGIFPSEHEGVLSEHIAPDEQQFLRCVRQQQFVDLPPCSPRLYRLCTNVLQRHTQYSFSLWGRFTAPHEDSVDSLSGESVERRQMAH